MKEFTSQTGGRYTYIDDILNLQDLSLALINIFDDCDNFIISGCKVTGNSIGSGFVYINGKIRYCNGTTEVTKWPVYIYENNSVESVNYADSNSKVGRNIFGCVIAPTLPSVSDPVTGKPVQYITIDSTGTTTRIKDAFFGKYSLLLNPDKTSQTVNNDIVFAGNIDFSSGVTSKQHYSLQSGNLNSIVLHENDKLIIKTTSSSGTHSIEMSQTGAFEFKSNGTMLAKIDKSGSTITTSLNAPKLIVGNILMIGNDIYNNGTATNEGVLNINMVGHNGDVKYFRNTVIGDGKGNSVFSINGSAKTALLKAGFTVSSTNNILTIKQSELTKIDSSLQSYIKWTDKNNADMAFAGYIAGDFDYHIKNHIGEIKLDNSVYVAGDLFVSGKNVMSTLVDKVSYTSDMSLKANVNDVYSKTDADNTFIKKTDSISVFVEHAGNGEAGKLSVCNTIGACSKATFDNHAVQKQNKFKDIVDYGLPKPGDIMYVSVLEERKRELCANIGAAYKDDVLQKQKDTGWLPVVNPVNGNVLYVRQIGNIVSIQGSISVLSKHRTTAFTLPNSIDPPTYKIGGNCSGAYYHMHPNDRNCYVEMIREWQTTNVHIVINYMV